MRFQFAPELSVNLLPYLGWRMAGFPLCGKTCPTCQNETKMVVGRELVKFRYAFHKNSPEIGC